MSIYVMIQIPLLELAALRDNFNQNEWNQNPVIREPDLEARNHQRQSAEYELCLFRCKTESMSYSHISDLALSIQGYSISVTSYLEKAARVTLFSKRTEHEHPHLGEPFLGSYMIVNVMYIL